MKSRSRGAKGQTAVIFTLVLVALLGATALGTDVAVMYANWSELQKAVDAGALAGANFLPNDPASAQSTANQYAQMNGLSSSEITAIQVSSDDQEITVSASRNVPYFFGRVLGLSSQMISVTATAAIPYSPSTIGGAYNGTNSGGGGTTSSYTGSYGTSVGQYGLVPIGLDSNTTYSNGQSMTLHNTQVGAGNWGTVELGSPGGSVLRSNFANGYSGPISVGDWINTEPGKKIGPVDQGLADRLSAAQQIDPNGTFSSHSSNDPRILFLPMVNWESPNGRRAVQVTGFAAVWLDGVSGGDLQVHFITQVAPDSLPDANAPYSNVRGAPILIK